MSYGALARGLERGFRLGMSIEAGQRAREDHAWQQKERDRTSRIRDARGKMFAGLKPHSTELQPSADGGMPSNFNTNYLEQLDGAVKNGMALALDKDNQDIAAEIFDSVTSLSAVSQRFAGQMHEELVRKSKPFLERIYRPGASDKDVGEALSEYLSFYPDGLKYSVNVDGDEIEMTDDQGESRVMSRTQIDNLIQTGLASPQQMWGLVKTAIDARVARGVKLEQRRYDEEQRDEKRIYEEGQTQNKRQYEEKQELAKEGRQAGRDLISDRRKYVANQMSDWRESHSWTGQTVTPQQEQEALRRFQGQAEQIYPDAAPSRSRGGLPAPTGAPGVGDVIDVDIDGPGGAGGVKGGGLPGPVPAPGGGADEVPEVPNPDALSTEGLPNVPSAPSVPAAGGLPPQQQFVNRSGFEALPSTTDYLNQAQGSLAQMAPEALETMLPPQVVEGLRRSLGSDPEQYQRALARAAYERAISQQGVQRAGLPPR